MYIIISVLKWCNKFYAKIASKHIELRKTRKQKSPQIFFLGAANIYIFFKLDVINLVFYLFNSAILLAIFIPSIALEVIPPDRPAPSPQG